MKYLLTFLIPLLISLSVIAYFYPRYQSITVNEKLLAQQLNSTSSNLAKLEIDYQTLKQIDQYKLNQQLDEEISNIQKTYKLAVAIYEDLLDLKVKTSKTTALDEALAKSLSLLSQRNYASASALLVSLNQDIKKKETEIAASIVIPPSIPPADTPPSGGYRRQLVQTGIGDFMVDIITADLASYKVVVDTASASDCHNNCPVLSLAEYAGRSNAYAAINGPYFCPSTYPSCADKTNSFDTLLMNKNKTYFNSDNNVYSSVPAAIFSSSSRFISKSSEWGRDISVDSVIAGQPLLVFNGQATFSGDGDAKKTSKGARSFIGASDNTVYIGVVHNATVAEVSQVLAKLGIKNALNLDSGASTGLWLSGKSLITPGRLTPFGILLVRR